MQRLYNFPLDGRSLGSCPGSLGFGQWPVRVKQLLMAGGRFRLPVVHTDCGMRVRVYPMLQTFVPKEIVTASPCPAPHPALARQAGEVAVSIIDEELHMSGISPAGALHAVVHPRAS